MTNQGTKYDERASLLATAVLLVALTLALGMVFCISWFVIEH